MTINGSYDRDDDSMSTAIEFEILDRWESHHFRQSIACIRHATPGADGKFNKMRLFPFTPHPTLREGKKVFFLFPFFSSN